MTEEAKEARRAYYREWYRKNPEKAKARKARYWEKKAQQMKEATEKGAPPSEGGAA